MQRLSAHEVQCARVPNRCSRLSSRCRFLPTAILEPLHSRTNRSRRAAGDRLEVSKLRLYLDSAKVSQWELWRSTGLFYGYTTNPRILEKDGVKCNLKSLTALAKSAFELGASELQIQSWGDSVQKLSSNAFDVAGINPDQIVVKLPCTLEGIQTAALLRESNIRVCITGIFAAPQTLIAQAVGAEYAAPYLGRMNDVYGSNQGAKQVGDMQKMIDVHHSKLRLLVASIRETQELSTLAAQGCDTFTISPAVASKLFNVAYTIDASADFEAAAQRNGAYDVAPAEVEESKPWASVISD